MGLPNLIFLLSYSLIFCTDAINECPEANNTFFGAQIFLLYAPYYSGSKREQIIIYYNYANYRPGDVIILIENNTSTGELSFSRHTPTYASGFIFTNIPTLHLNRDSIFKFRNQLEGHCAYWERENIRSKHFCLTSHPQWMYYLRHYIGDRTLENLFLPGTHQSGAYSLIKNHPIQNIFAAAQNKNILEQLILGARYLDLRPSYYNGVYYNSHSFYFMETMRTIFNDIKEFLDNTQEIVIVSFKEFYSGFETFQAHIDFTNYLSRELHEYFLHKTDKLWFTTLEEIWDSNKRLIISYDHPIYEQVKFMWPHIPHVWGNIPPGDDLKKFIADAEKIYWRPKVTIAAYTMNLSTILINIMYYINGHKIVSLHDLAVSIGPNITQWYNQVYQYSASVIAVDYIQTTGIVDVAIEWNKRYSSPCIGDYYKLEFARNNS